MNDREMFENFQRTILAKYRQGRASGLPHEEALQTARGDSTMSNSNSNSHTTTSDEKKREAGLYSHGRTDYDGAGYCSPDAALRACLYGWLAARSTNSAKDSIEFFLEYSHEEVVELIIKDEWIDFDDAEMAVGLIYSVECMILCELADEEGAIGGPLALRIAHDQNMEVHYLSQAEEGWMRNISTEKALGLLEEDPDGVWVDVSWAQGE